MSMDSKFVFTTLERDKFAMDLILNNVTVFSQIALNHGFEFNIQCKGDNVLASLSQKEEECFVREVVLEMDALIKRYQIKLAQKIPPETATDARERARERAEARDPPAAADPPARASVAPPRPLRTPDDPVVLQEVVPHTVFETPLPPQQPPVGQQPAARDVDEVVPKSEPATWTDESEASSAGNAADPSSRKRTADAAESVPQWMTIKKEIRTRSEQYEAKIFMTDESFDIIINSPHLLQHLNQKVASKMRKPLKWGAEVLKEKELEEFNKQLLQTLKMFEDSETTGSKIMVNSLNKTWKHFLYEPTLKEIEERKNKMMEMFFLKETSATLHFIPIGGGRAGVVTLVIMNQKILFCTHAKTKRQALSEYVDYLELNMNLMGIGRVVSAFGFHKSWDNIFVKASIGLSVFSENEQTVQWLESNLKNISYTEGKLPLLHTLVALYNACYQLLEETGDYSD